MIRVSSKHGVNPAIPICFFCGDPKNEIILAGRLPGDLEAPKNMVWDKEPCDKCQEYMKQGIILISVKDTETDRENPYRTGGWAVVKEDAIKRWINPGEFLDSVLKKRICFVPDKLWDSAGLPREGK